LWHKHRLFSLVQATDVHHIFGRSVSDAEATCIHLCRKCHTNYHNGTGILKEDFVALMQELYQYQYPALWWKSSP
jgi:hypothetical protein